MIATGQWATCGIRPVGMSIVTKRQNMTDWIKTREQLPKLYAPVLTDTMFEAVLTPEGWSLEDKDPEAWAYINKPGRDETQQSVSEWGQSVFGRASDPALLVGRALNEFAELMEVLLPERIAKEFTEICDSLRARVRTPKNKDIRAEVANELADIVVVLLQAAEGYGVDLLGVVDAKMEINRSRKWKIIQGGIGQHE
jgi:NTP pyrophosphatase (non-canonical NTP hydrolase)